MQKHGAHDYHFDWEKSKMSLFHEKENGQFQPKRLPRELLYQRKALHLFQNYHKELRSCIAFNVTSLVLAR